MVTHISTRYFILIHWDKEYLKYCLTQIEKEIRKVKLELNKKTKIYNMKQGINFLGYRFVLKEKKLYILMNKNTKKRIIKRLNKLQKRKSEKYPLVKASYKGYIINSHCNSFLYKHKWFQKTTKNRWQK